MPKPVGLVSASLVVVVVAGCAQDPRPDVPSSMEGISSPAEVCLAMEAAAPPTFEDWSDRLRRSPSEWPWFRSLYEMASVQQSDLWFLLNDSDLNADGHAMLEAAQDYASALGEVSGQEDWRSGAKIANRANSRLEDACAEIGAEIDLQGKIFPLYGLRP